MRPHLLFKACGSFALIGATLSGCGQSEATCAPVVVEQLDSDNSHLLPGSMAPDYLTDPPTSGPHVGGVRVTGIRNGPIGRVEQVSSLETGVVIVQYRSPLKDEATTQLSTLPLQDVAIAPNDELPAPIVVTGWSVKMTCQGVNRAAIEQFVNTYSAPVGQH